MSATNSTLNVSISWTPPGAPVNSGNVVTSLTTSSNSQNVGRIDVKASDGLRTEFAVPFGSIEAVKMLFLKNSTSVEMGLRINGSPSDIFSIPPGGLFFNGSNSATIDTPIYSISLYNLDVTGSTENIDYYLFGE